MGITQTRQCDLLGHLRTFFILPRVSACSWKHGYLIWHFLLAVLRSSSSYVIQLGKWDLGVSLYTCLRGDRFANIQGVEHHLEKDFVFGDCWRGIFIAPSLANTTNGVWPHSFAQTVMGIWREVWRLKSPVTPCCSFLCTFFCNVVSGSPRLRSV